LDPAAIRSAWGHEPNHWKEFGKNRSMNGIIVIFLGAGCFWENSKHLKTNWLAKA
jgi:hypothetical protein